jgi:fucose 4-O-acetylase-like acetyltransferase
MNLSQLLAPLVNWFKSLGMPELIVHWGHPAMMGIVIFVLGSYVAIAGWRGRTLMATDKDAALKNFTDHRKLAPLMTLFLTLGFTGGVLSMAMHDKPLLESPHFWTGSIVLILLYTNGAISTFGFLGKEDKANLRTLHAYLGSAALVVMVLHAVLGVQLGLSI